MRLISTLLMSVAALCVGTATGANAMGGGQAKVDICHFDDHGEGAKKKPDFIIDSKGTATSCENSGGRVISISARELLKGTTSNLTKVEFLPLGELGSTKVGRAAVRYSQGVSILLQVR